MVVTQRRMEVMNLIWAILAHKIEFKLEANFTMELLKDDEVKAETSVSKEREK
jgi:hypothetical protein